MIKKLAYHSMFEKLSKTESLNLKTRRKKVMKNNTGYSKYTNKITEIFSDPDNAIGILEELNIGKFDEIQRVQEYDRLDGRKGLVFTAKTNDPKSSDSTIICIDIKEGHPSTPQVHELIYGAGKDSDVRFIIFSTLKDENNDDPTDSFSLVERVVDTKNQYPLNLYLVNFYEPMPEDNWNHFFVYTAPPEKYKYTLDELESEQTFLEAEFWFILVGSLNVDLYRDYPPPLELFDYDLGHYTQIGGLQVKAGWNDGKAFVAIYSTEEESDLVNDIWRSKNSDLKQLFQGYKVNLEFLEENKSMITVTIFYRPIDWLLKTDLQKKMDFARMLHRVYAKMIDFVKEET
jgi:hypothetical protein